MTGTVVLMAFFLLCAPASALDLKADEDVLFFPTDARFETESGDWVVPIHGWVFEYEPDSVWRSALLDELLEWLELRKESVEEETFRGRALWFLADSERGKELTIGIAGEKVRTPSTGPDGHFRVTVRIPADRAGGSDRLSFRIPPGNIGGRERGGSIRLVPPEGLSVISDIDDTIKISNVPDREELLANTFLREYRPVPGMAEVYRAWEDEGAAFHYVSASPWQLYQPLADFLSEEGFPAASLRLRSFRVKDRTFFNLFASPEESKIPVIESILSDYPGRRFILVGDSGEKDPEVYGEIARRHPGQVVRILIRDVPGGDSTGGRMKKAFAGLDGRLWRLFRDGEEIVILGLHNVGCDRSADLK